MKARLEEGIDFPNVRIVSASGEESGAEKGEITGDEIADTHEGEEEEETLRYIVEAMNGQLFAELVIGLRW